MCLNSDDFQVLTIIIIIIIDSCHQNYHALNSYCEPFPFLYIPTKSLACTITHICECTNKMLSEMN